MTNYVSTVRKESKSYPGVFYTLAKMSEARRAKLRLDIAEPTSEVRRILRDMRKIEETSVEDRTPDQLDELMSLADELDNLASFKIDPAWLRWGLKKLEGLTIDDQEADVEMLITDGPPMLFAEIVQDIKATAQLNGEEEKNSASLTTSGEETGGKMSDSTATSASPTASSEPETALATSQS